MYDLCKHCEWINKPYWSIVSPCQSCPNNMIGTYHCNTVTTTDGKTLTIHSGKHTGDVFVTGLDTNLPTEEEYRKFAEGTLQQKEWSEPKYICPECGGGMCRNEMYEFASYPPKYQYQCNKCGHIDYQYI
jgi:hypothetical protein